MAARFAVTTGNWSGAIWAATSGGAAGSAAVPTSADDATINTGVVVTVDNTTAVANSITINGTLQPSTSANSKITTTQNITVANSASANLNYDLSSNPSIKGEIRIVGQNGGQGYSLLINGPFMLKGANKTNATYTKTSLTGNSTTSVEVDDATGWLVGDKLVFATTEAYNYSVITVTSVSWSGGFGTFTTASTTGLVAGDPYRSDQMQNNLNMSFTIYDIPSSTTFRVAMDDPGTITDGFGFVRTNAKTDVVTISSITPTTGTAATITWTDGTGASGAVAYNHSTKCLVGNFTRNVIFGTDTPKWTARIVIASNNRPTSAVIKDVMFDRIKITQNYPYAIIQATDLRGVTELSNMCFFDVIGQTQSNCVWWVNSAQNSPIRSDNMMYGDSSETHTLSMVNGANQSYEIGDEINPIIFRSYFGIQMNWPGAKIINPRISGCVGTTGGGIYPAVTDNTDPNIVGGAIWGCYNGIYVGQGQVSADTLFDGTRFGIGDSYATYDAANTYDIRNNGNGGLILRSCLEHASGLNISNIAMTKAKIRLLNRNGDTAVQEIYQNTSYTQPSISRGTTFINRSTSNIKFQWNSSLNYQRFERFSILTKSGSPITLIGYFRKNSTYGSSTLPYVEISGLGITPVRITATSASTDAWEKFSFLPGTGTEVVQNSGSDGLLIVSFVGQSPNSGAFCYFSGVPISPFVTRCRHYGYLFDETIPTRTINVTVSASESTAVAYTGISISWGTSSSPTTITADTTFQKFYDYSQAQACLNVGSALNITGAGTAGSPSLFAQANITINTGYKINGSGNILIDGHTLTTEFTGAVPYTFTGGTWSQAATVPSFNGGQLNIAATGTYIFTMNDSIISMTPSADGTYSMGSGIFSGTIDLRNTTAHNIVVQLPSGTSYTTANNTGGTITVSSPTLTQGITFTGVVNGTQVKIFDTGTTTELYSSTSSPYSFSQTYSSDITVDYTIMKVGYLPIRVTGLVLSSSVLTSPISQIEDRSYQVSSGLTFGTTATVNTTLKQVTVGASTTIQNWYSFMIESWIAETSLKNKAFPFTTNGPNSFSLNNAWVWGDGATSIAFLSRDGMRYVDASGNVTAMWAAILTSGTAAGLQVRYQQTDGGTTVNAANTGAMDQLVQILSDPNGDGSYGDGYDYRSHLVLKIQEDGYDQAEADIYVTYGQLEDQLYVAGLNPISNGLSTGNPSVTGITITDHGASPVTWNSKSFSITITDSASPHTGTEIMRWLRYNFGLGGTFQGTDAFNWHDLVQTNGDKFKTVRGSLYGDTGATLKGVRVVKNDGSTAHADFNLFTADDGTTYATPLLQKVTISGAVSGSRIQLYDLTSSTELYNGTPTFPYTWEDTVAAAASRAVRLRVTYVSGTTAKEMIEGTIGTCGITTADYAITYTVNQVNDSVYINNAVDGSLVSNITIDDSTNLVKIAISAGESNWPDIYAYQVYWLNTATGIQDDFAFIQAIDSANYVLTSFLIKNTSSPTVPLTIINGYGKDSATGLSATLVDTTGGNIYFAPDHVVPYGAGAGLTAAQVWGFDITTVSGAGEAGKKLNDLSAGANPWDVAVADHTTSGTFGALVQKLLTVAKFLGLK